MFLRRCAFGCLWLVVGLFTVRHPEHAAHTVRAIACGLALVADGLARFTSAF
ncbi:hypothetical protein [Actinomadura madurae]|uniref:hypothetical protein n=1 Tax=Actinomadura madurae TaxID=1993 RepID=UPI0020D1F7B3|nr:hypothetical protein [Actinomadura madurae]MCP9952912.1 hypothetical protein [Actinomadura madurae]MCP9969675.1 hypothetical protein [Actinomadura madurae]MCP9982130.1 hypothetical protein [Actinomadura madurae]MCQ0006342.1 hypothetical protein [Actinomadura madurae]MCQ0018376.1 hypothetical protein [Actinomadura madurae]